MFIEQRFLQLFDEHAPAADLRERRLREIVPGGFDDDNLGFDTRGLEDALANVFGLPFGEQAASRPNADGLHGRSRPGRKRSRMASTLWILRRRSFSF